MSFGFSSKNNNGITQIDQNFRNYSLFSLSTINLGGYVEVPHDQDYLMFFRPLTIIPGNKLWFSHNGWVNKHYDPWKRHANGTHWADEPEWTYYGGIYGSYGGENKRAYGVPLEVAVFSPVAMGPQNNYGLEVFNSSGEVVFSSNNTYANIVAAGMHYGAHHVTVPTQPDLFMSATVHEDRNLYVYAGGLYPDYEDYDGELALGVRFLSATSFQWGSHSVFGQFYSDPEDPMGDIRSYAQDKLQMVGEF